MKAKFIPNVPIYTDTRVRELVDILSPTRSNLSGSYAVEKFGGRLTKVWTKVSCHDSYDMAKKEEKKLRRTLKLI